MATEVIPKSAFEIEVEKLIDKQLNTYKDHSRIISDYHAEKQIAESYNGRQLLELLQNADDAGTDEVLINLKSERQILRIANNGTPFDISGVQSLMLSFKSSKNKRHYIGNKGLGFRSVLNWVTEVKIKTRDCILEFSPEMAKANFEKLIPDASERNEIIKNEEDLKKNEVPFGLLSIPKLTAHSSQQDWETVIELKYDKSFEDEIIEQVKDLKPEILLFLNHTQKIIIQGAGELDEEYVKSENPSVIDRLSSISVNEVIYNVYSSGEKTLAKKNKKFYSYKIAWQADLSDQDSTFFTFFPTQVYSHLPFLIHGTFDLDPTRNHFNKSEDNDFILNEIAESIGDIAVQYLKKERCSDWRAYRFLSVTGASENKHLTGFFKKVSELRSKLEIYPCVDGTYISKENAVFHGDEFSEWVLENNLGSNFPNLTKSFPKDIYCTIYNEFSLEELINNISNASKKIGADNKLRAEFIKLLTSPFFNSIAKDRETYLPLLVDEKDNIVESEQLVFLQESLDYDIPPGLIKLSFLSRDLYKKLLAVFEEEIQERRIDKEDESRPLKRIIGSIVNIGAKDINEVIRYIVREIEDIIKATSNMEKKNEVVLELHKILFSIFEKRTDRKGILPWRIPIFNRYGEIKYGEELFFGKEYSSGINTEFIFEGIYSGDQFLAGPELFDLEGYDCQLIESFFQWLGVTKYLQLQKVDENTPRFKQHLNFIYREKVKPHPVSRWYFKGTAIENEKIINDLSPEKLVLLIALEKELNNRLALENDDELSYYYNRSNTPVYAKPSFIHFQLVQNSNFEDILIEEDIDLGNSFKNFRYQEPLFEKNNIEIETVKQILSRLGAIKKITDIEPRQFYGAFNTLKANESQGFYKRFFEYCRRRDYKKDENIDFSGLECYARKGGSSGKKLTLKPVSEIFYSDNDRFPQSILNEYWILNLPKRLGEDQVQRYFGINLLKDEERKLKILSQAPSYLDQDFNTYLNQLKPYFLCYRLSSINKNIQNEVEAAKKLKIHIVESCSYSFREGSSFELQENDFLIYENTFFIKNSKNSSLSEIQKVPEFCDSIAEILCIHFKVKEHKNNFRSIFKDGIKESAHLIKKDDLENYLTRAKTLLGVTDEEFSFWSNLAQLKDLKLEYVNEKSLLVEQIKNIFGYSLPQDYNSVDFTDLSKPETYKFIKEFNTTFQVSLQKLLPGETEGFKNLYKKKVQDFLYDQENKFQQVIWQKSFDENLQQEFIETMLEYNQLSQKAAVKSVIDKYKFTIDWEPQSYIIPLIENEFNIKWNLEVHQKEIKNLYEDLLKEYEIEENEFDANTRSLLYFPGNEEKIRATTENVQKNIEDEKEKTENLKITGKLNFDSSTSPLFIQPSKNGSGNKKKGWTHGKKDDRRNKRLGKLAERTTYNSLVEKFGKDNVRWVSGNSDTPHKSDEEHYDMRYRKSGKEWYYLEVKAFNGQSFYLSREEKRFGQEKKGKYEIALVQYEDIHICSGFFADDIDFENNTKFHASPGDYLISLKLKKE